MGDEVPPIVPYTQLYKVDRIEDLMDKKGRMILLYLTQDQ